MGTWGFEAFDNDDASDWLYDLEESTDTSVIAAALEAVTENEGDDLEAPDCWCALAAAEIVAALRGHPPEKLPEEAQAWVDKRDGTDVSELVPSALQVIERIRTDSELKELWDESGGADWYASLDNLAARLNRQ